MQNLRLYAPSRSTLPPPHFWQVTPIPDRHRPRRVCPAEAPTTRLVFVAAFPELDRALPRALAPDVDAALMAEGRRR